MLRSLHMKLVMIMVLLILSLMMVVGAFLINSVTAFYLEDFYSQMGEVFQEPSLYHDLTTPSGEEENGAEQLALVLEAYAGELGVDNRNRKLYILDGNGVVRVSPDGGDVQLEYTENLTFALASGLETGEYDFAEALPFRSLDRIKGNKDLVVQILKPEWWIILEFNPTIPPFNNVKMRQAVLAALDEEKVMQAVAEYP